MLGSGCVHAPSRCVLGRSLFVHGGVAPQVVDGRIALDSLNQWRRDFLAGRTGPPRARDVQLGLASVTQYRGLIMGTDGAPPVDRGQVDAAGVAVARSLALVSTYTSTAREPAAA